MKSHVSTHGSERRNRPNLLRPLAATRACCDLERAPIRSKERQASLPKRAIGLVGGAIACLLALSIVGAIPVSAEAEAPTVGFAWTHQFGTPSNDDARAVVVDASGVYVAGWTNSALPNQTNAGGADAFVREHDFVGGEVWTRQFGSSRHDQAFGAAIDPSGVYVVGETQGILPDQTSPGCVVPPTCEDVFLRKYDRDGNEIWTRQFGTPDVDIAYEV